MALRSGPCGRQLGSQTVKGNGWRPLELGAAGRLRGDRRSASIRSASSSQTHSSSGNCGSSVSSVHIRSSSTGRRELLQGAAAAWAGLSILPQSAAAEVSAAPGTFTTTPSGLKYIDVRVGDGATPRPGDRVAVHWSGYTKGYQGKRIGNTSLKDEPYEFVLGAGEAITAFEEAVSSMKAGGIRRVEVPGARPELGYALSRAERFTGELISADLRIFKYRKGPQPDDLGGQRALDFVLDNTTLQDFNRDLLFDVKLLSVYRK